MIKVSKILLARVQGEGWFLPDGKVLEPEYGNDSGHADLANEYRGTESYDDLGHIDDGVYSELYEEGWIRFCQEGSCFQISASKKNLTSYNIQKIQAWLMQRNIEKKYVQIDIDKWAYGSSYTPESIKVSWEDFMCADKLLDLKKTDMLVGA